MKMNGKLNQNNWDVEFYRPAYNNTTYGPLRVCPRSKNGTSTGLIVERLDMLYEGGQDERR